MVALILTAFALFLRYPSLILADATLLPALNFDAEPRNALIRGLIDLEIDRRQYYCPTSTYICESSHCCPNYYPCCRGGSCCSPNTYCVLASNGIIGCCPVGRICSGPVDDPTTTTIYYTSTSTRTSTFDIPTTTTYPTQAVPSSPTYITTSSSTYPTLPVDDPTVQTPTASSTTSSTSSFAGNSTSSLFPFNQSTIGNGPNPTQSIGTRSNENAVFLLAMSTFCITFYMMIL